MQVVGSRGRSGLKRPCQRVLAAVRKLERYSRPPGLPAAPAKSGPRVWAGQAPWRRRLRANSPAPIQHARVWRVGCMSDRRDHHHRHYSIELRILDRITLSRHRPLSCIRWPHRPRRNLPANRRRRDAAFRGAFGPAIEGHHTVADRSVRVSVRTGFERFWRVAETCPLGALA